MGNQPEGLMEPADVWGARWDAYANELARRYMEVTCRKQSLVILAADLHTMDELNNLVRQVGPHIAALKTHVDFVEDWTVEGWMDFCSYAKSHDLLIFEDRKFADIGAISRRQMGGVYNIQKWADIVTAHGVSGPDIVSGLCVDGESAGGKVGVLLLAQMSSRDNLLALQGYTKKVVEWGTAPGEKHVLGFIGNGSRQKNVAKLRGVVGERHLIWTPGVNIDVGDGEMGQRYGSPRKAIRSGSDGIIVGSGIYKAEDPRAAARAYADISWQALLERSGA